MARFGRPMFANTIILGALAKSLHGLLDQQTVLDSILEVIPKFHEENTEAFRQGFALGEA